MLEVEVKESKVGYLTKENELKTVTFFSNEGKLTQKQAKELITDEQLLKVVYVENIRKKYLVDSGNLIPLTEIPQDE